MHERESIHIEEGEDGLLFDPHLREVAARMPGNPEDREVYEALGALRTADHALRIVLDRWAEHHGMTDGRARLLYMLRDRAVPLGALADSLDVSPRNVTGLVDQLERAGLVERVPDEHDRRSVHARLTPAGLAKLELLGSEMRHTRDRIAPNFSSDELAQLRHLSLKLLRNIINAQESESK